MCPSYQEGILSCRIGVRSVSTCGLWPQADQGVFRGFVYVGEFLKQTGRPLQAHRDQVSPLPRTLETNFDHVWHLEENIGFEKLACQVLPKRPGSAGTEIIDQPPSWMDMLTPNLGNPVWQTRFRFGGRMYLIGNQYGMRRAKQFALACSNSALES